MLDNGQAGPDKVTTILINPIYQFQVFEVIAFPGAFRTSIKANADPTPDEFVGETDVVSG